MQPLGLTAYRLAKDLHVPVTRIQAIIAERRRHHRRHRAAAGTVFRHRSSG